FSRDWSSDVCSSDLGVLAGEDPSHADDGNAPAGLLVDAADDFGGALRQGAAAQPSGLVSEGGRGDSVPGEGGVGGDETVHAHVQRDVYRFLPGFVGQ